MNLYFKTLGEGKPLLVLHGLFGSGDNWLSIAKHWSESHKVYLVDQRNHGHSPFDNEMNYEVMSEDLYELLANEGLRDVLLLGHSMGGKTVMRFAQKYDFLIEKMIVADMGIKKYKPHHEEIFKGLLASEVDKRSSRKEVEDILSLYVPDEGTKQFLLKNLYWREPGKLAWRFNLPVLSDKRNEVIEALPEERIQAETLFITGGKSSYVPQADFDSIRSLIPNSTFETIPNAGHWLHAEAPQEFVKIVSNFIAE